MTPSKTLKDNEVEALANEVLGREMVEFGFKRAEVRSGEDYDDTPSLFITVKVGIGVPAPLPGGRLGHIRATLHKALLARGEDRFPYFRLDRADGATLDDDMSFHPQ